MLNDLSYAFRTLRKSPIFTITVVITIALAIGASTAIFSVTNGVLLRQLPYKDPERLVLARGDLQRRNVKDFPLSNADFLDLRNGAKSNFEEFAAVSTFRATLPGLDGICRVVGWRRAIVRLLFQADNGLLVLPPIKFSDMRNLRCVENGGVHYCATRPKHR